MSKDDILTDDFVADMLVREADSSLKYSSLGMEEFRSEKKPANKPKPNKNFLQRIIKSTDSYNAGLLANEAAESQARLESLQRAEERQRRRQGAPQDVRRRQMGDIKAILGGRSTGASDRRKETGSKRAEEASRKDPEGTESISDRRNHRRRRSRSPEREDRSHGSRPRRRRRRDEDEASEGESDHEARRRHRKSRRRSRSPDDSRKRKHHRSRSRSPRRSDREDPRPRSRRRDEKDGSRSKETRRRRSASPSRHRQSSDARSSRRRHREDERLSSPKPHRSNREHKASKNRHGPTESNSDSASATATASDPLDDIIGPAPPPPLRKRGRGFDTSASRIDKHFEADYDPRTDVEMDAIPDAGAKAKDSSKDWDDAVESFRDRVKWQQHQEQRLRDAGFNDDDIDKWKRGGEGREEDVRWSKAGEQREWDRGKDEFGGGEPKGLFSHDDDDE